MKPQATGCESDPSQGSDHTPEKAGANIPNKVSVGMILRVGEPFQVDFGIKIVDDTHRGYNGKHLWILNFTCFLNTGREVCVHEIDDKDGIAMVSLSRKDTSCYMYYLSPPVGAYFFVPIEVLERWRHV